MRPISQYSQKKSWEMRKLGWSGPRCYRTRPNSQHSEKELRNDYEQARNQLGIPGRANSFLRGAQIFWTASNSFKLCPTHFSRGAKNFLGGLHCPWLRPDYESGCAGCSCWNPKSQVNTPKNAKDKLLKNKIIFNTENKLSRIPAGPDLADARPLG